MSLLKKLSLDSLDPKEVAKALLRVEPLGVLKREICPFPVLTDEEDPGMFGNEAHKRCEVIPPRLFFIPKHFTLVHCYGDDTFYEQNPEYVRGGVSKECYVLGTLPRFLSNQYALEGMLGATDGRMPYDDPISLTASKPPPMTKAEQKAYRAECRQLVAERISAGSIKRVSRMRLVHSGSENGQNT